MYIYYIHIHIKICILVSVCIYIYVEIKQYIYIYMVTNTCLFLQHVFLLLQDFHIFGGGDGAPHFNSWLSGKWLSFPKMRKPRGSEQTSVPNFLTIIH